MIIELQVGRREQDAGGVAWPGLGPRSAVLPPGRADRSVCVAPGLILGVTRWSVNRCYPVAYWRTSSGFEVDLIVGAMDLAIECKSARELRDAG